MTAAPPPPAAASWSLRGRLTRRVLIAVSLGWLASLVIGMLVVIHETNELLDDTLKTQARLTLKMLRDGGVDIARRTVAKYREAMRIPSSVQRRRLKQLAGA